MNDKNVVKLASYDLPPHLITAINAFDDVIAARVHRGMIVGMLHAYAHQQTQVMVDEGYA